MAAKYKDSELLIRNAKKEDMTVVTKMVQELEDFQKMSDSPKLSVKDLERDGFESDPPAFMCKVAEVLSTVPATIVGYALYYPIFSTWEGRAIMLQDLYVQTSERGRGVGYRLFDAVAKEAVKGGCSRVDLHVLGWNPARSFYDSKGAVNLTEKEQWCYYRLDGDALRAAAGH